MSFTVREGQFDVIVAAGPRVALWPSAGVKALGSLCAEMGLKVGLFGGETLTVKGVIPLPGTGALVFAQDAQGRVHRLQGRAVVRVTAPSFLPDPFPGWRSPGLIPLPTAEKLRAGSEVRWDPVTAILGTGNSALRFGSSLLESGVDEVYCIEPYAQWGAKRFAGWEVERRRFETAGGRLIEARPVSLAPKGAMQWQLRLQDGQGIRVLDVARVVSAGPFRDRPDYREHPAGSFLFELEQTAGLSREQDVQGWVFEEARGRLIGAKIVRALVSDLGERREALDSALRKSRGRLKRWNRHREEPFTPAYQGKWILAADSKRMRDFGGIPKAAHKEKKIASIECFEEIPCNVCQNSCPEKAIEIGRVPRTRDSLLTESRCTGCGICVSACPSGAAVMVHEREDRSVSSLVLPWKGSHPWIPGDFATLLNRRGESLGSARVVAAPAADLVEIEVPTHLLWDARGLRRGKSASAVDEAYLESVARSAQDEKKVEITLNGEKRLARDQISITTALFEMGQARPEDVLFCEDGSCGLCHVLVDGVKKAACRTRIHRGMGIKLLSPQNEGRPGSRSDSPLCPCLNVNKEEVVERLAHGNLQSPEAVISVTSVGEGKCHGQLCIDSFRRVLIEQGVDAAHWVDWRFPWSDWVMTRS